ncbi:MarR family winged helix-turn-helix transcriptional regulator [Leifsonia sp. Root112D2]|uniref:MarR family winged helix-turn-helix transcriptional regulator n=1 Tax=Leifsonia sp. Root112D2 TaxID=1736426 RepID=UPI0006F6635E|nr:MarR family transcriptional regulator [Leifsonia sp. Root112D2]KQV05183.1 hypothetical protein ASC63_15460 [Leifsonia sp. Root112D2]
MTAQPATPPLSAAQDNPLSWAVFTLARSHRALAASLLAPLGLFPGQELMLFQLWDCDGRSQKELGDLQKLDHSTVAKSVQRLERAGLVTRSRSSEDGRVTLVHLTHKGRALEQPVRAAWAELEERTAHSLSADQREVFATTAARLLAAIEATPPAPLLLNSVEASE